MYAIALAPLPVRTRPSARKSIRQVSPRANRTDREPLVSVADSSSTRTWTSVAVSAHSASSGPRAGPPSKWVISTPMTPGSGLEQRTVRTVPSVRSPLRSIRRTGAYTVRESASGRIRYASAGQWASMPSRSRQ